MHRAWRHWKGMPNVSHASDASTATTSPGTMSKHVEEASDALLWSAHLFEASEVFAQFLSETPSHKRT